MDEFEKNDEELERIAAKICGALDGLKLTAEDMEKAVDSQGKMLKAVNEKAEDSKAKLT